jgi:circadian clock protein KaiB
MPERERTHYEIELFVADHEAKTKAIADAVSSELERQAPGRYRLTTINVLEHPELAVAAKVFATPMLIRSRPAPSLRVLGDLSDSAKVLRLLGIDGDPGG